MPKLSQKFFVDDEFEEYADPHLRRHKRNPGLRAAERPVAEIVEQDDSKQNFDMTYKAARHEFGWLINSLGGFYEQRWINDILRIVKGGKEASVYLCQGTESTGEAYVAAKVYRPRQLRNLRNDSLYREGRANLDVDGHEILDDRQQRAMRKRTAYGQELMHTSWLAHEFTALQTLHTAGADVPMPYATADNAILMQYVCDEQVAAPTLNTVTLAIDEARQLFERVIRNVAIMLEQDRVHGDLSAYNILYWQGEITLIDFPQAISPHENRNAFTIFMRDMQRICEYFALQGVTTSPRRLAVDLWTAHGNRLTPDFDLNLLDANDDGDRQYWQEMAASQ